MYCRKYGRALSAVVVHSPDRDCSHLGVVVSRCIFALQYSDGCSVNPGAQKQLYNVTTNSPGL